MHYCIGDVHGCFDQLMEIINKIENTDPDARFILLGDIVDRGPKTYETLKWAVDNVRPDGKYQMVMGNHENLVLEWYYHKFRPWYENGCKDLMPHSKFDFYKVVEENDLSTTESLRPIIHFLKGLPLSIDLDIKRQDGTEHKFVCVHAWYDKHIKNHLIMRKTNLNRRCFKGHSDPSYTVVFGHTPTNDEEFMNLSGNTANPGKIAHLKGAINIDGGCCFGMINGYMGHLCCICLETGEEYYA